MGLDDPKLEPFFRALDVLRQLGDSGIEFVVSGGVTRVVRSDMGTFVDIGLQAGSAPDARAMAEVITAGGFTIRNLADVDAFFDQDRRLAECFTADISCLQLESPKCGRPKFRIFLDGAVPFKELLRDSERLSLRGVAFCATSEAHERRFGGLFTRYHLLRDGQAHVINAHEGHGNPLPFASSPRQEAWIKAHVNERMPRAPRPPYPEDRDLALNRALEALIHEGKPRFEERRARQENHQPAKSGEAPGQ